MHIARYEKRLFAYLFDSLLSLLGGLAIFLLIPMPIPFIEKILLSQVAAAFIYVLLTATMLMITNGFTFGSLFVRVRVVRLDEKRLRWREVLIRSVALSIFVWALINAVYMLTVHTERTMFDRISDTIVIDKKCY
ncbi:MAG: RDD family protein [Bacilli bacterium]|jgi:uncharacterized RDD family membrane protein YckC